MPRSLEGRTIALAETRQLEELAGLLESEGATALRCPLVSIHDAPDPQPIRAWIDELCQDRFSHVVLMTGEALRRLLHFAAERREAFLAALRRTKLVTRGPKPGQVLKAFGLAPTCTAPTPTTEGVIAALRQQPLQGQTVGVTLFGEANPVLEQFLVSAGAQVRSVMPYVYGPATDDREVAGLIDQLAGGRIDVMVFTSSPQVDRLWDVAQRLGLQEALQKGMSRTRIAAVGPLLAEHLREHGVSVAICPEQGFVMKNLVQHIKRAFGG